MSTSIRSADDGSYHHGNLREALVAEGLRLLEEAPGEGFSLRELARRVGVSANATYRHFASKDALLQALAAEGFRRFALAQARAARGTPDPREGFLAAGQAYVAFASAHPALFRLMFGRFSASQRGEELAAAGQLAFDGLCHGVAAALGQPVASPAVEVAALQAWSLVHGLSHLLLDGQLQRYGDRSGALLEAVLRHAAGLRHESAPPPAP